MLPLERAAACLHHIEQACGWLQFTYTNCWVAATGGLLVGSVGSPTGIQTATVPRREQCLREPLYVLQEFNPLALEDVLFLLQNGEGLVRQQLVQRQSPSLSFPWRQRELTRPSLSLRRMPSRRRCPSRRSTRPSGGEGGQQIHHCWDSARSLSEVARQRPSVVRADRHAQLGKNLLDLEDKAIPFREGVACPPHCEAQPPSKRP